MCYGVISATAGDEEQIVVVFRLDQADGNGADQNNEEVLLVANVQVSCCLEDALVGLLPTAVGILNPCNELSVNLSGIGQCNAMGHAAAS